MKNEGVKGCERPCLKGLMDRMLCGFCLCVDGRRVAPRRVSAWIIGESGECTGVEIRIVTHDGIHIGDTVYSFESMRHERFGGEHETTKMGT